MRGRELAKLMKAVDLLAKPAGVTINEMQTRLEMSRRSVYRMIERIEDMGFPLFPDEIPGEKEKKWKLEPRYVKKLPNISVPDFSLTLPEIMSLYLLKSRSSLFRDTEIEKHIASAYKKMGCFLPEKVFQQLEKIGRIFISFSGGMKDYSGKEEIIEKLGDAMLAQKSCYVKYHSFGSGQLRNFSIDPLHFFTNEGGLYLIVNATRFGEIRTLAVERIQEVTNSGKTFRYPENFDPEEQMKKAFDIVSDDPIDVKIRFSADQARYVKERKWAEKQEMEDQEDGSVILSMQTSGRWDVKRWVMSWGASAEVLEPGFLREMVMEELRAGLGNYEGGCKSTE